MSKDSTKQELIKELRRRYSGISMYFDVYGLSDFILERERKIVEPLVKLPNKDKIAYQDYVAFTTDAINQALKNAGIE